jgi:phosphatidate cytidylyltransferase
MLIMIDRYPQGNIWIFFLLAVIFASDTGAFYCGRLFGKHKLYEAISPGKTWEGAVGGVISSVIVALWFLHVLRLHRIDTGILAIVMGLSVIGQIGDLSESMLKRSYGVKDSSRILPGHGGILDRVDGLLFAIPVFYMYLRFKI